jgi:hypothetical protein
VGVAFILGILAAGFLLRRRRQKRNGTEVDSSGIVSKRPSKKGWDKPELEHSALPRTHGRAELEGSRTGTPVTSEVEEHEELDRKAETGNVLDEKERVYEI